MLSYRLTDDKWTTVSVLDAQAPGHMVRRKPFTDQIPEPV